jgi:hypothetical protein
MGGSWGPRLAPAFAVADPGRVRALVLYGLLTGRQQESDWLNQGRWRTSSRRGGSGIRIGRRASTTTTRAPTTSPGSWARTRHRAGGRGTPTRRPTAPSWTWTTAGAGAVRRRLRPDAGPGASALLHQQPLPGTRPCPGQRRPADDAGPPRAGQVRHGLPTGERTRVGAALALWRAGAGRERPRAQPRALEPAAHAPRAGAVAGARPQQPARRRVPADRPVLPPAGRLVDHRPHADQPDQRVAAVCSHSPGLRALWTFRRRGRRRSLPPALSAGPCAGGRPADDCHAYDDGREPSERADDDGAPSSGRPRKPAGDRGTVTRSSSGLAAVRPWLARGSPAAPSPTLARGR